MSSVPSLKRPPTAFSRPGGGSTTSRSSDGFAFGLAASSLVTTASPSPSLLAFLDIRRCRALLRADTTADGCGGS